MANTESTKRWLNALRNPATLQRFPLPACVSALVIYVEVRNTNFLHPDNLAVIGSSIAPVAVIAMGMAPLLITGYFDISVGGVAAFACVVGAMLMNSLGVVPGIILVVVICFGIGLLNAVIVVRVGVNSLVTTLGTGFIFSGLAVVVSGSSQIPLKSQTFVTDLNASPGQVPVSVMILVVVAALASWLMHTVLGRGLYAIGGNREAARYAGIPIKVVAMVPFIMTATFTGVAAIITLGFTGAGLPTTGSDWPLQAIAGSVIGGVSIAGGEGSIACAVFGMILIGLIQNGLVLLNINSNFQDIVLGAVIVLAVALDVRVRARLGGMRGGDARQLPTSQRAAVPVEEGPTLIDDRPPTVAHT